MKISIDKGLLKSLLVFGSVIEARDAYTGGHTWRVSQYSKQLAMNANLDKDQIFLALLGGYIHDLGKVSIPDNILNKPEALSDSEFSVMRNHAFIGKSIFSEHPLSPLVLDAVAHHHERIDGRGYPESMNGKKLSILARIVSIADAFDAMTSTRPYRKGMPKQKALTILQEEKGKQFDADLVDSFVSLNEKNILDHIIGHSDEGAAMHSCPGCGPIIAVPKDKQPGDHIHCPSCHGKFELHLDKDDFALDFKEMMESNIQPETDMGQINEFLKKTPKKASVPGK